MENYINTLKEMDKQTFVTKSFTSGLLLSLVGSIAAGILVLLGHKPIPHGYGYCFKIGKSWGGLNLGYFSFMCVDAPERTFYHEYGHALQNCVFGPAMPFKVTIPSAIRYWTFIFKALAGQEITEEYDAVWFEKDATNWGKEVLPIHEQKQ